MYRFSRAIYLHARDYVVADNPRAAAESHRQILAACEETMGHLAKDPEYYPNPSRALFDAIRFHFPLAAQQRVFMIVDAYVNASLRYLEEQADQAVTDGAMLRCRAQTRRGKACQRTPLPDSDFCPSHQASAVASA